MQKYSFAGLPSSHFCMSMSTEQHTPPQSGVVPPLAQIVVCCMVELEGNKLVHCARCFDDHGSCILLSTATKNNQIPITLSQWQLSATPLEAQSRLTRGLVCACPAFVPCCRFFVLFFQEFGNWLEPTH